MKIHFCLAISLFMLTGCSLFHKTEMTPEKKRAVVSEAAHVSTFIAITEINKDNKAKQVEVANNVVSYCESALLALSDTTNTPTQRLQEKLFVAIPPTYRAMLSSAIAVFNLYYEIPKLDDVLKPEQIAMLKAFFSGVELGAKDVLVANEVK